MRLSMEQAAEYSDAAHTLYSKGIAIPTSQAARRNATDCGAFMAVDGMVLRGTSLA